jgi:hypothetical protein
MLLQYCLVFAAGGGAVVAGVAKGCVCKGVHRMTIFFIGGDDAAW